MRSMPHFRFIFRDTMRARKQAIVFILCVTLAIVTLVAINGFSDSVNSALLQDARALHAADIIVQSRQEFSSALIETIRRLERDGSIRSARTYEFYSVVRDTNGDDSLLSDIKVVADGYPFYGRIELASGLPFENVLASGHIIVEHLLMDRLGLQVGDRLDIGQSRLTISDVLVKEPDRPVSVFSFGPRIFVHIADLEGLDLVRQGSRVRYGYLIKVLDPANLNRLTDVVAAAADPVQERVDTFRTARSAVKRFFDNFVFFLNLIGIFTLLLAGIGIHSTLTAYLKEKEKTIAVMKAVGATGRFVFSHFTLSLLFLSLIGTALGVLLGFMVQIFLPALFVDLVPRQIKLTLSWTGALEGLFLGVVVVALFASLPLYRLRDIKPATIFRKDSGQAPVGMPFYFTITAIIALFVGMVLWQLQEVRTGLIFVATVCGFIMLTALLARAALTVLRRVRVKQLVVRQALKGLFRPRNATWSIIITLTASLAVVFTINTIERNLDRSYVQSYPSDSPNLFFLDIQPDQLKAFQQALGIETRYFPIVRAKILSIDGKPIDRGKERQRRRGDNLARTFNLTYRDELLDDETIVAGRGLFRSDWQEAQVSVLDTVVEMHAMKIGDRISFRIQGVPIEARISSIRSRTLESLKPFFYFVFQREVLKNAPQTIFTAVRVEKNKIAAIQNAIVKKFPNVSVIDMTATIATLSGVSKKLSNIIRFFTAFSILAGLLITVSSVFATRLTRTREAVFYQVLGARNAFVVKVFALENVFIGAISGLLALLISQIAAWIVTVNVFQVDYRPFTASALAVIGAATALVIVCGLLPSWSILRQKPVIFLREQTQE